MVCIGKKHLDYLRAEHPCYPGAETPLLKLGGGGGGVDITLNKLTCLFAIVKSGLDQTSKCSRPVLYAWFKVQQL